MSELWTPSDAELMRHLAGDLNLTEARAIEQWLAAAPEHRQRLDDLRQVLQVTVPPRMTWDPARSWNRIAERIEAPRRPEIVRERPSVDFDAGPGVGAGRRWRRALIAAGVGAVLAAGWYAERQIIGDGASNRHAAIAVALTERHTGRGERAAFHLADGTEVMLGPSSRLRYSSADYGRRARRVELEGDGYFKVVHDEARPFVVQTATASIRDLGTRFAVRARAGARQVDVGVAEGRVAMGRVETPNDSIVLDRGDAAHLPESGRPEVRRVDVERYFAWTEGRLAFDRATLRDVVEDLERWYDVDIELADPKLERRVLTAEYVNKPIGDVLDLVAASLGLTVSGGGRRFVISAP